MKLKSEWLSQLFKILLWALFILAALDLAGSIIYAVDFDFYFENAHTPTSMVETIQTIVYYIVLVVYLIWIYRVHLDLNQLFPHYSITPGASLVRMMVPFYSYYGIPSTYLRIGRVYQERDSLRSQGGWIHGLAVPLLIFFLIDGGFNRVILRADELEGWVWIASCAVTLVLYAIFLVLAIKVSSGLQISSREQADPFVEERAVPAEMAISP